MFNCKMEEEVTIANFLTLQTLTNWVMFSFHEPLTVEMYKNTLEQILHSVLSLDLNVSCLLSSA